MQSMIHSTYSIACRPYSGVATVNNQELETLIQRIAERDQEALGQFYDQTRQVVFGLLVKILGDYHTAEETLIDVYMKVWNRASIYNRDRGTVFSWLITIARTRAIDTLRAGRNEPANRKEELQHESAEGLDPEQAAILQEQRGVVNAALAELQPEQRRVIELSYFFGMSHSEIAQETGEPLGTVKSRIRSGIIKLRDILRPAVEHTA